MDLRSLCTWPFSAQERKELRPLTGPGSSRNPERQGPCGPLGAVRSSSRGKLGRRGSRWGMDTWTRRLRKGPGRGRIRRQGWQKPSLLPQHPGSAQAGLPAQPSLGWACPAAKCSCQMPVPPPCPPGPLGCLGGRTAGSGDSLQKGWASEAEWAVSPGNPGQGAPADGPRRAGAPPLGLRFPHAQPVSQGPRHPITPACQRGSPFPDWKNSSQLMTLPLED